MATYRVEVVRTSYGYREIEVEASSIEEAEAKALDEAGNHLFSESVSDYSVENVEKVND